MLDAIPDLLGESGSSVLGAGSQFSYTGGVSTFMVHGTTLPTTVVLELMGRNGTTWMVVATATVAGLVGPLYLPPGTYRANMAGGSPATVFAGLFAVPHKK